MTKKPKFDLDLMIDTLSHEDLIKIAITKTNQINRKKKNISDKTVYGKYYQRHINSNLTNNHMITKSGNISKSVKNLSKSNMSTAMLKEHIRQLDNILTDKNFKTMKSTAKYIEEQIQLERQRTYSIDNTTAQTWRMNMKDRHGTRFNEMLNYVYNGDVKAFYSEFLLRKESLFIDLSEQSDDIFDNIYNDNKATIEAKKKEAEERVMHQYEQKLAEVKRKGQEKQNTNNKNAVQSIRAKHMKGKKGKS